MRRSASPAVAPWLAALTILSCPCLTHAQARPIAAGPASSAEAAEPPAGTAAEAAPQAEVPPRAEADTSPYPDDRVYAANNLEGTAGGLHTADAGSGPKGTFRLGLAANLFVKQDYLVNGDTNRYAGVDVTASVTPLEHFELSARLSTRSNSNENDDADNFGHVPTLLQAIGDLRFGAKLSFEPRAGVTVGGDVGVFFLNSQSEVGMELGATSVLPRANLSLDLRELAGGLPMLVRVNAGYFFDNSAKTVEALEDTRFANLREQQLADDRAAWEAAGSPAGMEPTPIQRDGEYRHLANRIERFAFGINRVDTVKLAVGAEWPLRVRRRALVVPIAEWSMDLPINRQGFDCPFAVDGEGRKLPGLDSCLDKEGADTYPQRLTAGLRVYPGLAGFSVLGAIDVGVGGTTNFVRDLAPEAPYRLYLAATYAVDTRPTPPVIREVERKVEVPVMPPMGRVVGRVVEQGTDKGVPGALVSFPGADLTPLYAGASGAFTSYAFSPGEVEMELRAEGYEPGRCEAQIPEAGGDVQVQCALVALPRVGSVSGVVLDKDGAPALSQKLTLQGAATRVLTTDALGRFKEAGLPPGRYTARVERDGHLITVKPFEVGVRENTEVTVQLSPAPRRRRVRATKAAIVLRGKIQFDEGGARIQRRSEPLLAELADLLLRTPEIRKIEIQGHTDNQGEASRNQELSRRRAEAVRDWLVEHGVAQERMVARGFGSSQAVVPNITPANRARNRRVQIKILERQEP